MSHPRRAFLFTIVLRVLTSVFAWRFGQAIPPNLSVAARNLSRAAFVPGDGWRYLLFGIWERFDSVWYLHIASDGYDRPAAIVFYPLYPMLIRSVTRLVREPMAAALLISTVATFFLLWGIQELAAMEWPGREATAMILLAAFPVLSSSWPPIRNHC